MIMHGEEEALTMSSRSAISVWIEESEEFDYWEIVTARALNFDLSAPKMGIGEHHPPQTALPSCCSISRRAFGGVEKPLAACLQPSLFSLLFD